MADVNTVAAPVKSAWASKINWIQVISALGTCATALISSANLPAAQAVALTASVGVVGDFLTGVVRTWFTKSVTPGSVGGQ